MPVIHDYECGKCGEITEHTHPMNAIPEAIVCPSCSEYAKKIVSAPLVFLDDGCSWVPTLATTVNKGQRFNKEKKIESRSEFNAFMKAHPNIRPAKTINLAEV